jgi:RNA-directed DNA polymerase
LPTEHKGAPHLGTLIGLVKRTVAEEGFQIHPEKTRVSRSGSRQKVTGLVVNGDGSPRVSRDVKRQIRAAVHNLKSGKPLKEGETLDTLAGYAAYIAMSEPELGHALLNQIADYAQHAST